MGCNGGWPEYEVLSPPLYFCDILSRYAANYLVSTGIPTDVCEPYVQRENLFLHRSFLTFSSATI